MAENVDVKYLIVGGGVAGAQAAVGIREVDSEGSVLLVGMESWWPYDRPPLSKGMLQNQVSPEDAESKDPSWYPANHVEVRRGAKATKIDKAAHTVTLDDGTTVKYEKLLLALGATPKPLEVPGGDLPGVYLLRTIDQSLAIADAIKNAKSAVMIGTGYIGTEVGSQCLKAGVPSVTLVDPGDHPWGKFAGPLTGNFLKRYYESKGAKFYEGDEVTEILGDGKVEGVRLKSGETLPADMVVAGVGVKLNVDLPKEAGFEIDEKHGVVVDEYLKTADPDVYVAGDIAAFHDVAMGKRWHAEHYLNGKWQGKQAGRNMAGANEPYDRVPYFFSDFLDLHMALRGDPQAGKPARLVGDINEPEFIELYAREDGTLAMGIAVSHSEPTLDAIADKLEELIRRKAVVAQLTEEELGRDTADSGLG